MVGLACEEYVSPLLLLALHGARNAFIWCAACANSARGPEMIVLPVVFCALAIWVAVQHHSP